MELCPSRYVAERDPVDHSIIVSDAGPDDAWRGVRVGCYLDVVGTAQGVTS